MEIASHLLFDCRYFAGVKCPSLGEIFVRRAAKHQSLFVQIFQNGSNHFAQVFSADIFFKPTNQSRPIYKSVRMCVIEIQCTYV